MIEHTLVTKRYVKIDDREKPNADSVPVKTVSQIENVMKSEKTCPMRHNTKLVIHANMLCHPARMINPYVLSFCIVLEKIPNNRLDRRFLDIHVDDGKSLQNRTRNL